MKTVTFINYVMCVINSERYGSETLQAQSIAA